MASSKEKWRAWEKAQLGVSRHVQGMSINEGVKQCGEWKRWNEQGETKDENPHGKQRARGLQERGEGKKRFSGVKGSDGTGSVKSTIINILKNSLSNVGDGGRSET